MSLDANKDEARDTKAAEAANALRRVAARATRRTLAQAGLHAPPHVAQLRYQGLLAGQRGLISVAP